MYTSKHINRAGGAATTAGINFQAAVSAIACVYMLRGQPLLWLDGLVADIPVAIDAETGGAGDDIRLLLKSDEIIEIQVKKGLQAGDKLWASLIALAKAITKQTINYGVLIVSSTSSNTIKEDLSRDIIRLGEGRFDNLSSLAKTLLNKFHVENLDVVECCQRIRIQTVYAPTSEQADIRAACSELSHLCTDQQQVINAWNSLVRDCNRLMELRGRRNISTILQRFHAEGIGIKQANNKAPLLLLEKLTHWVFEVNSNFSIWGIKKLLPIDGAWIPLQVAVQDVEKIQSTDLTDALKQYHAWDNQPFDSKTKKVDPETLGRFIPHAVLIGGPGMGKSTLLKRIARRYSEDRIPVLCIKLKTVAASMQNGKGFEEAMFDLALAESGITAAEAKQAQFPNWLVLCDGLDECGRLQESVATGIANFAKAYPHCRVIITTRPVGYDVAHFHTWRHYNLLPLSTSSVSTNLTRLLKVCLPESEINQIDITKLCKTELANQTTEKIIARSPLLLGLAASVIARGGHLSSSKEKLFEQLFEIIDKTPNSRTPESPASAILLQRYLDILGWHLTANPLCTVKDLIKSCAEGLIQDLGYGQFKALAEAESFLEYWQSVGMVEQINYGLEEVVSFIHKSFGEFAAARYLFAMPSEHRKITLNKILDDQAWKEVIQFAIHLGIADEVCESLLIGGEETSSRTEKVLFTTKILATANVISCDLRERILHKAFSIISSKDELPVDEIGQDLVSIAKRFPDELGSLAKPLLQNQQPWTYMVAWAVAVVAGKPYYPLSELSSALSRNLENIENGRFRASLGGYLQLAGMERYSILLDSFICNALDILLKEKSIPKIDELISKGVERSLYGSTDYQIALYKVLLLHEKRDAAEQVMSQLAKLPFDRNLLKSQWNLANSDYKLASLKRYEILFEALGIEGEIIDISNTYIDPKSLLNFSAFRKVSELSNIPDSDVWVWNGTYDKESTLVVLKYFLKLTSINLESLRAEAEVVRAYLHQAIKTDDSFGLYKIMLEVDPPTVKWSDVYDLDVDLEKIKNALWHPSVWIVWMAVNLIENLLPSDEREILTKQLLSKGRNYALWGACGFIARFDQAKAVKLLISRLSEPLCEGCEYLYEQLQVYKLAWSNKLFVVLNIGLYANVSIAMQAAKLSSKLAKPELLELEKLICEALDYWAKHEQPYPESGLIPDSPREELLKALTSIRPLTYSEIKKYTTDSRPNVKEFAEKCLEECFKADNSSRIHFLNDIKEELLSPYLLSKGLEALALLNAEEFAIWQNLINHNNPKIRFAAMSLLKKEYLSSDVIMKYAQVMINDNESEIYDRAKRILKDL